MNADPPPPMVKGWCPGALRPMQSGDGLIVRLKPPLGIVTVQTALQIAACSRGWGNGVIELSARANLQLRGVSLAGIGLLQSALARTDLIDDDARAEAVRNITLSPLSDIDPDAILDLHPAVRELGRVLRTETRLHDLPGKFGFALDSGGAFAPGSADVTFVACRTQNGAGFMVCLAGDLASHFGPCPSGMLSSTAVSLALAFKSMSLEAASFRRMRDLVARVGAAAVAQAAGLGPLTASSIVTSRPLNYLGVHVIGDRAFLGLGLPFGQIQATDFADLMTAAAAYGARDLRLTPYRAILVVLPSSDAARHLAGHPAVRPFIVDAADPRRRVAACAGAPACLHASTRTRADAAELASSLAASPGAAILVHVSGCGKGCAHPAASPITLIGRGGFYDLVLKGTASAQPVLEHLTLAQALAAATKGLGR